MLIFHPQSTRQSFAKLSPKKFSTRTTQSLSSALLVETQRLKFHGNSTARKSQTLNASKLDNMWQSTVMLYLTWTLHQLKQRTVDYTDALQRQRLESSNTQLNWTFMVCRMFDQWRKNQLCLEKLWSSLVPLLVIQLSRSSGKERTECCQSTANRKFSRTEL